MIQQFKIVNGYDTVKWYKQSTANISDDDNNSRPLTRGHNFKVIKEITKNNTRMNFLTNKIANDWNALPT